MYKHVFKVKYYFHCINFYMYSLHARNCSAAGTNCELVKLENKDIYDLICYRSTSEYLLSRLTFAPVAYLLCSIFIHLKQALLTQHPASNDEKYLYTLNIDFFQIKVFD